MTPDKLLIELLVISQRMAKDLNGFYEAEKNSESSNLFNDAVINEWKKTELKITQYQDAKERLEPF